MNTFTRQYNGSDANLIQRADALHGSMTRDAADFATRNISATDLAALLQARDAFSDFPTDEELAGPLGVAQAHKNSVRADLEKALRGVRHMAAAAWGERSGPYKTFRFEKLAQMRDNDFYRAARRVLRMTAVWNADLVAQGFTAAQTTLISNLITAFDTALEDVAIAEETRDVQTQTRIGLGNTLWALMQRYTFIGKSLFEDTDEAKYNDYLLH